MSEIPEYAHDAHCNTVHTARPEACPPSRDGAPIYKEPGPYATVTRLGRWLYAINISSPVAGTWMRMENSMPWYRYGRARAERCARRKLARHIAKRGWRDDPTIITEGE